MSDFGWYVIFMLGLAAIFMAPVIIGAVTSCPG